MVTGLLQQQASQLPPQLRDLANVAELSDALLINITHGMMTGTLSVSLLGRDEASAVQLEQTLNDSIDTGRMMLMAEMMKNIEGDDAVNKAIGQYVQRLGGQLSDIIRPKRKGNVVSVQLDSGAGNIGTMGVLAGLLLPAVQAAARRHDA